MNVDCLLFEGMDLMDFGGPWEVFSRPTACWSARDNRVRSTSWRSRSTAGRVRSYGGVPVGLTGSPRDDGILIVPGTIDIPAATGDQELVAAMSAGSATSRPVCTGAYLLAEAGMLPDRWTTHWEDIAGPALPGGTRARVVDAGTVVTGGRHRMRHRRGVAPGGAVRGFRTGLTGRATDGLRLGLLRRSCRGVRPVVVERFVAARRRRCTSCGPRGRDRAVPGCGRLVGDGIGGPHEYQFLDDAPDGLRGGRVPDPGAGTGSPGGLHLEPPPGFQTRGQHTWVVLGLHVKGAGTHVRLAHWGHGVGPGVEANREYFTSAWARVLDALEAHCA